ncbi:MAG: MolR family transcriptional regulator, partial [Actinomycetales bacterium]|nr:MolR family transcriptional regulator [Actinomycetales bacterium]
MSTIYLDDEDEGLARETSHPRFVELAPDSFYDESDEFSPFGNDDGNDALRSMEEWFEDREPGTDPIEFLEELLDEWDLDVPEGAFDLDHAGLVELVTRDEDLERPLVGIA